MVWQRETERCHAVESLSRASALIVTAFRAVLGSIAIVELDTYKNIFIKPYQYIYSSKLLSNRLNLKN